MLVQVFHVCLNPAVHRPFLYARGSLELPYGLLRRCPRCGNEPYRLNDYAVVIGEVPSVKFAKSSKAQAPPAEET